MITLNAYAKINLSLDVVGRLANGYHEVRMIMQTVGIHDSLTFEKTEGEIVLSSDAGELPLGEDNLIYKAAKLVKETYGISGGVKVHLEKRIPVAAGMAGARTQTHGAGLRRAPPAAQGQQTSPQAAGGAGVALPGRELPEEAGPSTQQPGTSSWLLFSLFCFF